MSKLSETLLKASEAARCMLPPGSQLILCVKPEINDGRMVQLLTLDSVTREDLVLLAACSVEPAQSRLENAAAVGRLLPLYWTAGGDFAKPIPSLPEMCEQIVAALDRERTNTKETFENVARIRRQIATLDKQLEAIEVLR